MYSTAREINNEGKRPTTQKYADVTEMDLIKFKEVNKGKENSINSFYTRVIQNGEYTQYGLGKEATTIFYLKDKHYSRIKGYLSNGISAMKIISDFSRVKINPFVMAVLTKIEENQSDISGFITNIVEPNLELEEAISNENEINFGTSQVSSDKKILLSDAPKSNIFGIMKKFGFSEVLCDSIEGCYMTGFDNSLFISITTEILRLGSLVMNDNSKKTEAAHAKNGEEIMKQYGNGDDDIDSMW